MDAGRFDTPIEIWRFAFTQNSVTGEKVKTWTKLSDEWAKYDAIESGSEGVFANQRENKQQVLFKIRYCDLKVSDRIVFDGQNYNVITISNIQRDMYLFVTTQLTQ